MFFPTFCLLRGIWQKEAPSFLTVLPTVLVLPQVLASGPESGFMEQGIV